MIRALLLVTAALALAACGEPQQELRGSVKQDKAAFEGTGMPYVTGGWKAGDKTSWEGQLKTRAQNGQNDYNKVN